MVQVEDDSSDDEAQESKAVYDYAAGKLNTVRVRPSKHSSATN